MGIIEKIQEKLSSWIVHYLQKELDGSAPSSTSSFEALQSCLRPGDVLLVEGNLRISAAIKYLTQSTWSHSAFYVGRIGDEDEQEYLVEADVVEGVRLVPLSQYAGQHTRICRPVELTTQDREKLVDFMVGKIGLQYDLKNAWDLFRYLLPEPPVPLRWRRRMLALGSGDPTRAICSTLIAQAFQSIRYPILPEIRLLKKEDGPEQERMVAEILHIRHYSLFTPRDFDISPYFQIVKPTLEEGFEYQKLKWSHDG